MDHYSTSWRPVHCLCGCGVQVAWYRRKRTPGAWRLLRTGHVAPEGFTLVTEEMIRRKALGIFKANVALERIERETKILHQLRTRGLDAFERAVVERGAVHVFMGGDGK